MSPSRRRWFRRAYAEIGKTFPLHFFVACLHRRHLGTPGRPPRLTVQLHSHLEVSLMKILLFALAASLAGAAAVQAAQSGTTPGISSTPLGATAGAAGQPNQNFNARPGVPSPSFEAGEQRFGASPGAPGSPSYNPFGGLPALGNSGSALNPNLGTSAAGVNSPSASSSVNPSTSSSGSNSVNGQ
jgi:hypothetical protein